MAVAAPLALVAWRRPAAANALLVEGQARVAIVESAVQEPKTIVGMKVYGLTNKMEGVTI